MGSIPYADSAGTGVTFRVWAPNATFVTVPGTFNGWSTSATSLVEEGTSGIWSADVPAARAGDQYKYLIDGTHWWKDPRSRLVSYSGYDTAGANSIVYDPSAFAWSGDTQWPVQASDLVIYELHVGSFFDPTPTSAVPGRFTDAIQKLDHLAALGINAVELLPVAEFPGDRSWGYNPADVYAVENIGYGGPDGLKTFVREAHARGLHVLLDVVHNHWGPTDFELYGFDTGPENRFYVYTGSGICCTPWGDRPNYANEGVRSFIIDNFRMWRDEYHLDGFRWDAVGAMRHYDPGRVAIPEADSLIQYINSTIIGPDQISIAEDDSVGLDFDSEWERDFAGTLIDEVVKVSDVDRDMNVLSARMTGTGFGRVLFSESHDLVGDLNGASAQRLPVRINPSSPEGYFARKRSMLAAAVCLTTPGIPMVFMGQEFLETNQFSSDYPLDWSQEPTRSGVEKFYRDLIHLRRNLDGVSAGLTGPNLTWHVVRNDDPFKLLAFHRWGAAAADQVMVIMNFTANAVPGYWIHTWPNDGLWYVNLNSDWPEYGADFDNMGSSVVNVSGGSGEIAIGPYSVLILSRQALPERDLDGDGLLNGWEQTYFGGPTNGVATADNDGDGADNLSEQRADTNPLSADSVLRFTDVQSNEGSLRISWKGGVQAQQVLLRASQIDGPWIPFLTNEPPTAITNSVPVPAPLPSPLFLRIEAR